MKAKENAPRMLAHPLGQMDNGAVKCTLTHSHLTQSDSVCQVISDTLSEQTEVKERFAPKRTASEYLALVFDALADLDREHAVIYGKKYERVSKCGSFLQFAHEIGTDGTIGIKGKLYKAEFCRERLCPMCQWRRSLKQFGQVSQIMDLIADKYKYLMLTLTVPNVSGYDLQKTIKRLLSSFNRLTKYKRWSVSVLGFFRALEVTYNENTGEFHPHLHVILAVSHRYFVSKEYINHDEWLSMWRRAYKDDSILFVNVQRVKGKSSEGVEAQKDLKSAVAEVAKYSVKDSDYLKDSDLETSMRIVDTLYKSLHGVRLCHFGGVFRGAYKTLKLEDAESEQANLIDVGEDKIRQDVALLIVQYNWGIGSSYHKGKSWITYPDKHKSKMSVS